MSLVAQAAAAGAGDGPSGYILWGVSVLLTAASTVIVALWRRDVAGMERSIAAEKAWRVDAVAAERTARLAALEEAKKLLERNTYLTQKIESVTGEYVVTREELARERARRETREEIARESKDPPPLVRTSTHPSLQLPAVPLPLPPPRSRGSNDPTT